MNLKRLDDSVKPQRSLQRRASGSTGFRKPRDCVVELTDSDASVDTQASSGSDCAVDLLWDRLSTNSSTEPDSDGWSNRSHSPVGPRCAVETAAAVPVTTPPRSPVTTSLRKKSSERKQVASPNTASSESSRSPPRQRGRTSPQRATAAQIRPFPTSSSLTTRVRPIVRPTNIGPPTEYDFRNTNGLVKCLNAIAQLPTSDELSAKHLVIHEVQRLVDDWLHVTFGSEQQATTATLLLGGSWHLKVGLFDSDLDIVTLLPNFVTAELFFGSLYEYLRTAAGVTNIVAMRRAVVPVLTFAVSSVRIDLLFARYTQSAVPKNLTIHSDDVLVGMDVASIRALSVPRVASLILELVPNGCAFRACLRIVRLWAKRRGLYSNKVGFLGGIAWTILVAFVCQLFPRATISSVLHRFFALLATWRWPTPVLIAKPCASVPAALATCPQWSPQQNVHDRRHVMPIITPGFPAVNAAVNVSASTLRILQEEFARGERIMDDMQASGLSSPAVWQRLFVSTEFLVQYDNYVVLELRANDDDELSAWSNFVASRTRKLVETLEHAARVTRVHPLPDLIKPTAAVGPETDDSAAAVGYYLVGYTVETTRPSVSRAPSTADVDITQTCVLPAVRYFMATELDSCDEKTLSMHVAITCVKWQDLPDALFPQGRAAAAGERARFILGRAHSHNIALGRGR